MPERSLHSMSHPSILRYGALRSLAFFMALLLPALPFITAEARGQRQQSASSLPLLVMGAGSKDLGEVVVGEELMQLFVVKNAGAAPLELSQAETPATRKASIKKSAKPRAAIRFDLFQAKFSLAPRSPV